MLRNGARINVHCKIGNSRRVEGELHMLLYTTHLLNLYFIKRLIKMQEAINFAKELQLFLHKQFVPLNSRV